MKTREKQRMKVREKIKKTKSQRNPFLKIRIIEKQEKRNFGNRQIMHDKRGQNQITIHMFLTKLNTLCKGF